MNRTRGIFFTFAALAGAAYAAPTYPTTLPTADLAVLIDQLGSDDPATVADASDRLAALGRSALPALQRRLDLQQAAAATLKRIDATTPLPSTLVSLHVHDATIDETLDALAKQIGEPVWANFKRPLVPQRITLDAARRPFWEVVSDLMDQAPIYPDAGLGDLSFDHRIYPTTLTTTRAAIQADLSFAPISRNVRCVSGPFFFRLSALTTFAQIDHVWRPTRANVEVDWEPTAPVLAFRPLQQTTPSNAPAASMVYEQVWQRVCDATVDLPLTVSKDDMARGSLPRLAGTFPILIGVRPRVVDASGIIHGKEVRLDGPLATLALKPCVPDWVRYRFDYELICHGDNPLAVIPNPTMLLTDVEGHLLYVQDGFSIDGDRQTGTFSVQPNDMPKEPKPPALKSAKVVVFDDVVEVSVPFEFTDVPLVK